MIGGDPETAREMELGSWRHGQKMVSPGLNGAGQTIKLAMNALLRCRWVLSPKESRW
jgi:3-hydroxyisobutyrate dehydrogenase-like beta-hydroxyacid dehydrogenase